MVFCFFDLAIEYKYINKQWPLFLSRVDKAQISILVVLSLSLGFALTG